MTPADYESVEHAGRVLHGRGWRKKFSAYDQLVDEYTNDLSCRDWLALAWPLLTEHVRSVRQAELDALDARFIAATTEDAEGRLAHFYRVEAKDGWWWRRLPSQRHGEFARDLDA
jgi:hypothetical protein